MVECLFIGGANDGKRVLLREPLLPFQQMIIPAKLSVLLSDHKNEDAIKFEAELYKRMSIRDDDNKEHFVYVRLGCNVVDRLIKGYRKP